MTAEKLFETLTKYAATRKLELNNDRDYVSDILDGLIANEGRYGYRSCPCRLATGIREQDADIICPCSYSTQDIAEYGSCYCSLYVTPAWNREEVPHTAVPERRA